MTPIAKVPSRKSKKVHSQARRIAVNIAKLPELVQGIRSETAQRSPVNQGQRLSLSRRFARVFCAPVSPAVFHGAMASIMIPIPSNTLAISLCTRPVSDFKNSCNCSSSAISFSSSNVEFDVNRAMEDRIRSASIPTFECGVCAGLVLSSSKSLNFDSTADVADGDFNLLTPRGVPA
jgi:hypothetical protein